MTTLSIVSVKFIFVVLVLKKPIYFDFFKFNDNLFIFSHSSILANSALIFVFVVNVLAICSGYISVLNIYIF